jgi:transposase
MTQMTLMTGAERRRRWSGDERRQILEAAMAPGAIVAEVGRRWDVSTSLIYKWRREELVAAQGSRFARVMLEDKADSSAPKADGTITVELGGARVRIGAGASAALAAAVMKALKS